jgi:hypothetical protein
MGARDWAVLAFKSMGVWFAASGVVGFANIPFFWASSRALEVGSVAILATVFPTMLSVVVGALVWINAEGLATRVFGEEPAVVAARVFGDGPADAAPAPAIETQPLFSLALSVIGVLLLVEAVPTIVHGLTLFVRSRQAGTALFGPDLAQQALIWSATAQANLAASCTRLVIGVALLAGPARLSAAYAGVRKELRGTLADDA